MGLGYFIPLPEVPAVSPAHFAAGRLQTTSPQANDLRQSPVPPVDIGGEVPVTDAGPTPQLANDFFSALPEKSDSAEYRLPPVPAALADAGQAQAALSSAAEQAIPAASMPALMAVTLAQLTEAHAAGFETTGATSPKPREKARPGLTSALSLAGFHSISANPLEQPPYEESSRRILEAVAYYHQLEMASARIPDG